jgi:hypothetical protein
MLHGARALALLSCAAPVVAVEPPIVLVCRGHEPEWSLHIDGPKATLATLEARGLQQTGFSGGLQEAEGRVPSFVYRGRMGSSGTDLVAIITKEACAGVTGDVAENDTNTDYSARLSMPDGEMRLGCCTIASAAVPPAEASPPAPAAESVPPAGPPEPTPAAIPATLPAATSSLPPASGEILALSLPDGRTCHRTGERKTTFEGRPVNFDCGRRGGDTVALVGALTFAADGLLTAQKAVIEWRTGLGAPEAIEITPARVSEVALSDALTCRRAVTGAALVFEGRRANYTCGMKDGETVALLGDPEPVEGGFRIVRARIGQGESGLVLRSSETIVITATR